MRVCVCMGVCLGWIMCVCVCLGVDHVCVYVWGWIMRVCVCVCMFGSCVCVWEVDYTCVCVCVCGERERERIEREKRDCGELGFRLLPFLFSLSLSFSGYILRKIGWYCCKTEVDVFFWNMDGVHSRSVSLFLCVCMQMCVCVCVCEIGRAVWRVR